MELADVLDSKSSGGDTVRVQAPPPAPHFILLQPSFAIIWRCRLVRSRAHDWKSCRGQKLLESSNLSISAKRKKPLEIKRFFLFCARKMQEKISASVPNKLHDRHRRRTAKFLLIGADPLVDAAAFPHCVWAPSLLSWTVESA